MSKSCSTRSFIYLAIIVILVSLFYVIAGTQAQKPESVDISTVVSQVQEGKIDKITVSGNKLEIDLKDSDTKQIAFKEEGVSLTEYGIEPRSVSINVKEVKEIKHPKDARKPPPIVISHVTQEEGYKALNQ